MEDKTNLASGTIFDEGGYDEMQKAENHKIGFRLFRIMFFVVLVFAFLLVMFCSNAENVVGTIVALMLMAVVMGFYILYAYMTAKKGIMNPKFAKNWSKMWVIIFYVIAFVVLWGIRFIRHLHSGEELYDIALDIVYLMISTEAVLMYLCAKKNNKVLKKQLEDDEE